MSKDPLNEEKLDTFLCLKFVKFAVSLAPPKSEEIQKEMDIEMTPKWLKVSLKALFSRIMYPHLFTKFFLGKVFLSKRLLHFDLICLSYQELGNLSFFDDPTMYYFSLSLCISKGFKHSFISIIFSNKVPIFFCGDFCYFTVDFRILNNILLISVAKFEIPAKTTFC